MLSYEEYLGYEEEGFDTRLENHGLFKREEKDIVIGGNIDNDMNIQDILKTCQAINISLKDEENEVESEVHYSLDGKYVHVLLTATTSSESKRYVECCQNVKYLSIGKGIEFFSEILFLSGLEYLEISDGKIENVLKEIYKIETLKALILDHNRNIENLPNGISKLKKLRILSIMYTNIVDLPSELAELKNLKFLCLNGTNIKRVPKVVMELEGLKELYLGMTKINVLPEKLSDLIELERLAIWETDLQELPEWIDNFKKLKGLFLGRTRGIRCLPETIGDLKELECLYLDGTGLTQLPNSFRKLCRLKELSLANTKIREFPLLNPFLDLELCDLSNMIIERVPIEFINDKIEIRFNRYGINGLRLSGTKSLCQPISLFAHEKDFIYAYYTEKKVHLNETKIVFLGDGEAGKSHIIKRIIQDNEVLSEFRENSTPGIAISQKDCNIGDEYVKLQIWDFGGQEIMHSMHRFFLTERTLYVIVVNARDNTQDERAQYWLNNIKSFANGCPVIIVLNKMDQNPSATLNERLLKNDYPQIADVIKLSALKDSKDYFQGLLNKILKLVRTFDSYAMDFPVSWNQIKMTLTEMKENYIIDPVYREICIKNNVQDEQIQEWLLDWFHDLGISFNYHRKDQLLAGYMVLKPDWITNAIYIILFNGSNRAKNGIIKIDDIVDLLKKPPKSVKNIKYNITEIPYILGVMRRFEISYEIDNKNEFIPMMCDRNQHEDAESFFTEDCLEYFMEYEYLPNNVLHKLMIKMRNDLDEQKIWLTGMFLKSREDNISSLVRMHGKKIEIFIKSKNPNIYHPKEYLNEIREFLLVINKELNLNAEDTIVYKEDKKVEMIKYKILLIYLSSGQKEFFSPVFRKLIPIKKILGLVEDENDTNLILQYCKENELISYEMVHDMLIKAQEITYENFEEDLIECCVKLQGNTLQIKEGDENDRNTYLRDLLSRNKKYIVCDQTLNGMSAEGKSAGELDLLIKSMKKLPFTILEALNLKSINKSYLSLHINKIFTYDTWGAENNYLIVYAQTENFALFCSKYKKFLSECKYTFQMMQIDEREMFTDIRIYDELFIRNEKETRITHILVKLQK